MLKFILDLLVSCWNWIRGFLVLYWHWVTNSPTQGLVSCWNWIRGFFVLYWHGVINSPTQGLVVSGVVAVVFGIISQVTGHASKRPILGTYETGRKEVVEEFGSTYIQDEVGVVEGKRTAGMRLSGCISQIAAILTFTFGFFAVVALIKLIF